MDAPPKPSDLTRVSLILRLKQDGPQRQVAWDEFYDLYAPVISGFGAPDGARPQDVEDLVQDVLKGFFHVSPEFSYNPAEGRFRGYLKKCVWNKLTDLRRTRAGDVSNQGAGAAIDPDEVAVEAVWNDVWETEKLGRALAIVRQRYAINPERQRTFRAFEMCTLLERPTEQVAAELGVSAESVRAAKSRVSKSLREVFDQMDELSG